MTQGKMAEISTQQIISCVTTDDDCNGGDLLTVFNYVMDADFIDCEVDYPGRAMEDVVAVVITTATTMSVNKL